MAGLHGCMPNYLGWCGDYNSAVDDLSSLHELGKHRRAELKKNGFIELNLHKDGNEYAEIEECDCDCPEDHEDY